MADKYDEAIARLSRLRGAAFKSAVGREWLFGIDLFQTAGPIHGTANTGSRFVSCGCLTQIRSEESYAAVRPTSKYGGEILPELTEAIRADERIPDSQYQIKREHLPVFAEWQRRLDKELGRT